MGIAVLGPLAVDGSAGSLRHHDRVVLTVLAMRPGQTVSAERLADALWGDTVPDTWAKVVQGCVVRLRKALGADAIETTPHGYRLMLPAAQVDSARFERLVGRGRELLALAEPDRAAHVLDEAVALWRGPALVELDGWDGGRAEATRLDELRRSAEELSLDAALRAGHAADVLTRARQLVDDAPMRERRWALLALAQYQSGQQADALATLREVRTVLGTELGIDPGPELVALEQAILRQDPTLAVTSAGPAPSTVCPYRGLLSFGLGDDELFFGREAELEECLRRLTAHGVLAVVGPSGSGKSSLVRAGIAAALARGGRGVRITTPGAHPLDVLDGLPPEGTLPVLVVDQCEEAVTLCESAAEQTAFFDLLATYPDHAPLVVALRADQMGTVSSYPGFVRVLERGLFLLGPMSHDQLRACIERPAEQAGLLLEPGLVDLLLRDVEDEPGALPLLSHALRQTWRHREGRTLTVAGYHASGGIRGAVAQTADEVHHALPEEQRRMLRDLMLRLVTQAPDGQLVRARATRRVVARDAEHAGIVERLVAARLLVSHDREVELAHEALIRAWPRLQQWLADDAEGQRIRQHLSSTAEAWDAMGRPASELYRGVRLAQALDWRRQGDPDLTAVEREFLAESGALVDVELTAERRARRRTRRLAMGLAAALALALVAAASATRFQQEAADRAAEAATASTEADANRLAALSKSVRSLDLSMLLAAEAMRTADTPATRDGLLSALVDHQRATQAVEVPGVAVNAALGNDGRTLFVSSDAEVLAWDVSSGGSVLPGKGTDFAPVRTPTLNVVAGMVALDDNIAAAPHDDLVAIWSYPAEDVPRIQVFDRSGAELMRLTGRARIGGVPDQMAFAREGRSLLVGLVDWRSPGPRTRIAEFDLDTGERLRVLELERVPGFSAPWIGLHEGATTAVTWVQGIPRPALLVDLTTGSRSRLEPREPAGEVLEYVALPTGVAQLVGDGSVTLYDGRGRVTQTLTAHVDAVRDVVVSPRGDWAATGDASGQVIVWDVDPRSGRWSHRESLAGHEAGLSALTLSADGDRLVSFSQDGSGIVWDMSAAAGFGSPRQGLGDRWMSNRAAVLVPGRLSVAPTRSAPTADLAWWDQRDVAATFLDPRTGRVVDQVPVGESQGYLFASSAAASPDRSLVAVTYGFGTKVLDVGTRTPVATIELPDVQQNDESAPEPVWCSGWTPDGRRLLLCADGLERKGEDGNLVVVDTRTWEVAEERVDVGGAVQTIEVSPDARLIAVGMVPPFTADPPPGLVKLLDSGTLEVVGTIELVDTQFPFDVAWSPSGDRLAIGLQNGMVAVADVRTGKLVHPPARVSGAFVTQVEWLPDGETVAAAGADGTVSLYDTRRGLLRATLPVGLVEDFTFTHILSFTEESITAVTGEQRARSFSLDPDRWLDRACAIAGRDLTRNEWASHLPDRPYRRTCSDHT